VWVFRIFCAADDRISDQAKLDFTFIHWFFAKEYFPKAEMTSKGVKVTYADETRRVKVAEGQCGTVAQLVVHLTALFPSLKDIKSSEQQAVLFSGGHLLTDAELKAFWVSATDRLTLTLCIMPMAVPSSVVVAPPVQTLKV
jgi:hypothetical protein